MIGILSLVVCGLLGPVAWVMGTNALEDIDRNPLAYSNRGLVAAGRVCGIVATVILVVSVLLMFLLVSAA